MGFWERLVFLPIAHLAEVIIRRLTAIGRGRSLSESDCRCANLLHSMSTTVQMSSYENLMIHQISNIASGQRAISEQKALSESS